VWVILYLSRERQHFKNTLVYIRRNKAKNYGFFWGGKSFFSKYFIDFFDRFLAVFFEILRMQLDFFLYDFWIFLVFYSFFIERKKNDFFFFFFFFFLMTGLAIEFFCTHAGFFFFLQIIHVESKIQLHLPIILVAVNAFIGVSDVKEKVLFMVFLVKWSHGGRSWRNNIINKEE